MLKRKSGQLFIREQKQLSDYDVVKVHSLEESD